MKASFMERFVFWLCDTFGHKKGDTEWAHNGVWHYNCARCGRIVSEELK